MRYKFTLAELHQYAAPLVWLGWQHDRALELIKAVHIADLPHGCTIVMDGELKTFSTKYRTKCSFMGWSIYGQPFRKSNGFVPVVEWINWGAVSSKNAES